MSWIVEIEIFKIEKFVSTDKTFAAKLKNFLDFFFQKLV
jgi:hypothetical protein